MLQLAVFPTSPTRVMPNTTAAAIGSPSSVKVNGLNSVLDTLHHLPKHAAPATWAPFPAAFAGTNATPSISDVAVLNRRDAAIIYVPAVKGAADYRAYIVNNNVTFTTSAQPRGAVIACAGWRQRFKRNFDQLIPKYLWYGVQAADRELLQAVEVPGLVNNADYTIVVEALATPCPFPGAPAHTSALVTGTGADAVYFRGFDDVKKLYGNEILNGQGSAVADYANSVPVDSTQTLLAGPIGQPVPPTDPNIPADPKVIARSAVLVTRPAADEATNGPIFDVGTNAIFDDFPTDGIMTSFVPGVRPEGAGLNAEGAFGNWFFWTRGVQPANGGENGKNPKGVQVWQRHGRLYTAFGDWGQDVMSTVYFTSTKTAPVQLDTTKYVHSMWRVDSGATDRRYWHWMMCGGDTRDELVDPVTHIPRTRPTATEHFQDGGAHNPSSALFGEPVTSYQNKECLNLFQNGGASTTGRPGNATSTFFDESHSNLQAFINPAGTATGRISLTPVDPGESDPNGSWGMPFRLNANKEPTGGMFEPFDQQAPLTHFDVFVRPDRLIFYINGRQAWCSDLSTRPLAMKYGLIVYGSVLYHSGAELFQYNSGSGGTFHYVMNTPYTDMRAWDVVAHSEKIDIPTQFTFDPATCFKPASTVSN